MRKYKTTRKHARFIVQMYVGAMRGIRLCKHFVKNDDGTVSDELLDSILQHYLDDAEEYLWQIEKLGIQMFVRLDNRPIEELRRRRA